MRDNSYLKNRLEVIWNEHFSDLPRPNLIQIKFGRRAKKRLGSIGHKKTKPNNAGATHIRINGHFKHRLVPEYVLDATIVHELCHYAHGFGSSLPRACSHPHRGGVIEKEFRKRGLSDLAKKEWQWLQKNWNSHLVEADSLS